MEDGLSPQKVRKNFGSGQNQPATTIGALGVFVQVRLWFHGMTGIDQQQPIRRRRLPLVLLRPAQEWTT